MIMFCFKDLTRKEDKKFYLVQIDRWLMHIQPSWNGRQGSSGRSANKANETETSETPSRTSVSQFELVGL